MDLLFMGLASGGWPVRAVLAPLLCGGARSPSTEIKKHGLPVLRLLYILVSIYFLFPVCSCRGCPRCACLSFVLGAAWPPHWDPSSACGGGGEHRAGCRPWFCSPLCAALARVSWAHAHRCWHTPCLACQGLGLGVPILQQGMHCLGCAHPLRGLAGAGRRRHVSAATPDPPSLEYPRCLFDAPVSLPRAGGNTNHGDFRQGRGAVDARLIDTGVLLHRLCDFCSGAPSAGCTQPPVHRWLGWAARRLPLPGGASPSEWSS